MKLICIKNCSLVDSNNLYFIKNKIYDIIKDDDSEYVIDDKGFMWRYSTVSHYFISLKELRKEKLYKLKLL